MEGFGLGSSTKHKKEANKQQSDQAVLPTSFVQRLVVLALAAGLVAGAAGGWLWQTLTPSPADEIRTLSEEDISVVGAAEKIRPSVVSILSEGSQIDRFGFGRRTQAAGTGIIVTDDGLILTNRHVVDEGTDVVIVYTDDGEEYEGAVVARDSHNDLAFIRIEASNLTPAELGDSSEVAVGQRVLAVGNALGQFQNTVTIGIISGLGRPVMAGDTEGRIESLQNLLQTDAAINPGNSGGPLVTSDGRVIGINTAIAGGSAENIGFAIPINEAKPLIRSVREEGRIIRAFLGVRFVMITRDIVAERGLPVREGALIESLNGPAVIPGGPADQAGLRSGDILIRVDDEEVGSLNPLSSLIAAYRPGDEVALTILRGNRQQTLRATLAEAP